MSLNFTLNFFLIIRNKGMVERWKYLNNDTKLINRDKCITTIKTIKER